eukprot:13906904-Ditylum_brightwellii.AAC.1
MVFRKGGKQAKTAYENAQLCAGLETGIEGAVNVVCKCRGDRVAGDGGDDQPGHEAATEEGASPTQAMATPSLPEAEPGEPEKSPVPD